MTCPISNEPTDQLCILKCQHILSLKNFKKLKQKRCPKCREIIEDNDIKYVSQNTIYKNLYSYLYNAGHILPSDEFENLEQLINNQSDSDDSEVDLILAKKKNFVNKIKVNSKSIFQIKSSKKTTSNIS
ncbi:hypothetical protein RclHR1_01620011 [Rhizophagus clarus]|uniref:Uncharacterized protein n=1 Tax=Rhizophagus clarus TaxID=94130 RepID=A0A2Z6QUJ3_9GLOM|nr:hypothetical protein RclHR1_01620011 [Rhizophagus clarus]